MIFCVVFILGVFISGCAVYIDVFVEDYTEWYTEDGACGFIAAINNDSAYGYFTVNGIKVRAYYQVTPTNTLQVTFPYSEELNILTELDGARYEVEYGTCGGVMEGSRDGNVFHVSGFRVGYTEIGSFDMYSRKIESADINARDYTFCTWAADDESVIIEENFYGFDVHTGTAVLNGETHPVYFKWCDNNCFEIYSVEDGQNVLASGTYTNAALDLYLFFETDTAFGSEGHTINLTGAVR